MWDVSPTLVRYGEVERPSSVLEGIKALRSQGEREKDVRKGKDGLKGAFRKPIENLCVLCSSSFLFLLSSLFPSSRKSTDSLLHRQLPHRPYLPFLRYDGQVHQGVRRGADFASRRCAQRRCARIERAQRLLTSL
jgi:hypothetical protein